MKFAVDVCLRTFPQQVDSQYVDTRVQEILNGYHLAFQNEEMEKQKNRLAKLAPALEVVKHSLADAYLNCLISGATKLATISSEAAETISTAAFASCANAREKMTLLRNVDGEIVFSEDFMGGFEKAIRPQVILAVIVGRAKIPVKNPSPERLTSPTSGQSL